MQEHSQSKCATQGQSLHLECTTLGLFLHLKCIIFRLSLHIKCTTQGLSLCLKCTTQGPQFFYYYIFNLNLDCMAKINDCSLHPFFYLSLLWPNRVLQKNKMWSLNQLTVFSHNIGYQDSPKMISAPQLDLKTSHWVP